MLINCVNLKNNTSELNAVLNKKKVFNLFLKIAREKLSQIKSGTLFYIHL